MNHLAAEPSPYLRQHRDNPVDWYPWGEEAFAAARAEDRPLFVSIGYSACHWCHVMAHESFEDPETAELVNAGFVAVKVDREEHPDVDAVYMEAVQALTGQGGWPLTIFCTPDGRPFFGGTYFPRVGRGGLPSFTDLCRSVAAAWEDQRDGVLDQADALTRAVRARLGPAAAAAPPPAKRLLDGALERLEAVFDPEYGGIGDAPKFPQTPLFELALEAGARGRPGALDLVTTTLLAMASGGIYDHLGGGFARYSVDRLWLVPHFEKMLYDQAGLARLALHCWQSTGDARFLQVCSETLDYVLRDLALPGGGFASAEDADSEGGEGHFYTWTPGELAEVLGTDAPRIAAYYGVEEAGNFEGGRSILHRPERGAILRDEATEAARAALFAARSRRPRPGLDDKVLTEWNAMTVATLAEAAAATGEARWREAAVTTAEFLLARLRDPAGRWHRSFQGHEGRHLGVASDYARLLDAFTRLGELTGESRWTVEAEQVAGELVRLFGADDGGFCATGADAPPLVVRPRDTYDGVLPAAGSLAALALARLGALTGSAGLTERARAAVSAAGEGLERVPMAFPTLVSAALLLDEGAVEVVVAGDRPDLLATVRTGYRPSVVLAWGERTESPLWEGKADGAAYVCREGTCRAPSAEPEALAGALAEAARR